MSHRVAHLVRSEVAVYLELKLHEPISRYLRCIQGHNILLQKPQSMRQPAGVFKTILVHIVLVHYLKKHVVATQIPE